mmetsp:Transcript_40636/g.98556  ORF Transcript_40636/g.98556 Transcript_40636/m.98556 type:complete len:84 (+) Transcript_40636:56-307(+)
MASKFYQVPWLAARLSNARIKHEPQALTERAAQVEAHKYTDDHEDQALRRRLTASCGAPPPAPSERQLAPLTHLLLEEPLYEK